MSPSLSGSRVVSLAVNLPGPLAAAHLYERGARVVKVEPPGGDPFERLSPSWYRELVDGQEVVRLDLKDGVDRARFDDLLVRSDVLITSMRPSALRRLGLEESLRRARTGHVEIVGHDGVDEEVAGHDLTYQAVHGTLQPPHLPLVLAADVIGGERATSAALAVLRRREHGEPTAHERVVLAAAAAAAGAPARHGLTGPGAILGGALPEYGLYATADGCLAVAALEPHFRVRLADTVGAGRDALATAFATQPTAHWVALAATHDLPLAPVVGPAGGRSP